MKKVLFWAKAASVQILYLFMFFVGIGLGWAILIACLVWFIYTSVWIGDSVWFMDSWWWLITFFPFFPPAYFLKYVFKIDKKWWFLNSTKDGDFGAFWWRRREGITEYNFKVAFLWWWRNPTWNFRLLFEEDSSKVFNIEIIKCTVPNLDYKIDYANRDTEKYGTNHVYYTTKKGYYHGRYSRASPKFELQFGVDKFRLKFGKAD